MPRGCRPGGQWGFVIARCLLVQGVSNLIPEFEHTRVRDLRFLANQHGPDPRPGPGLSLAVSRDSRSVSYSSASSAERFRVGVISRSCRTSAATCDRSALGITRRL